MRSIEGGKQQQRRAHDEPERISDRAARSTARPDMSMLDARVPSHDEQGHAKRWNVDVPVNFHAQVARFVEQGTRNFDNVSEFVRWAVLFAMDYLERLDPPQYASNTQVLKGIATEVGSSETRRQYQQSIERTSSEVFELLGMGMHIPAEKLVQKTLEHIRQLPKDDEWRAVYEQTFKHRFGHVLKRGKIVNLSNLHDDDDEEDGD
jgi:hypothetical protein